MDFIWISGKDSRKSLFIDNNSESLDGLEIRKFS